MPNLFTFAADSDAAAPTMFKSSALLPPCRCSKSLREAPPNSKPNSLPSDPIVLDLESIFENLKLKFDDPTPSSPSTLGSATHRFPNRFRKLRALWDNGTPFPEPWIDRIADTVGKYEALAWLCGGLSCFAGLGLFVVWNDKASKIPFAPKVYPSSRQPASGARRRTVATSTSKIPFFWYPFGFYCISEILSINFFYYLYCAKLVIHVSKNIGLHLPRYYLTTNLTDWLTKIWHCYKCVSWCI